MDKSLQRKIKKLQLHPVNDEVYHSELKDLDIKGHDVSGFKYYKKFNNKIMLYSETYLVNNTLDDLIEANKKVHMLFNPSICKRIVDKLFALRMKWRFKRHLH